MGSNLTLGAAPAPAATTPPPSPDPAPLATPAAPLAAKADQTQSVVARDAQTSVEADAATQAEGARTIIIDITPTAEEVAASIAYMRESNERYYAEQRALIVQRTGRTIHPVCDLFPLMSAQEIYNLADDIETNGLLTPIVTHEGQIVDGRNRLLACFETNPPVPPRYVEWRTIYTGPLPLVRWIWSVNAERRHLTNDQIAATRVAVIAWEEQEAARQRQATGKSADGTAGGRGKKRNPPVNSPEGISATAAGRPAAKPKDRSGETCVKIAKETGVSEHKVRQALKVQKADPELLRQAQQGKITLREAEKEAKAKSGKPTSKAKPRRNSKTKTTKAQQTFDLEREIKKVMVVVDAVLDACGEDVRDLFLSEVIKTLELMK